VSDNNNTTSSAGRNILAISKLERQAFDRRSVGERFGDAVALYAGRLWFLLLHAVWFGLWIAWNLPWVPVEPKFDPFPFPALTTAVSLEAIFLSLFILMSENRSKRRADERAQLDLQVNLLAEAEATKILQLLRALCAHYRLPEAEDPELAELIQRMDPDTLARGLENQLPTDRPKGVIPDSDSTVP
jgi:uncharacterized membrane protein